VSHFTAVASADPPVSDPNRPDPSPVSGKGRESSLLMGVAPGSVPVAASASERGAGPVRSGDEDLEEEESDADDFLSDESDDDDVPALTPRDHGEDVR
jgi:hypothetical protein